MFNVHKNTRRSGIEFAQEFLAIQMIQDCRATVSRCTGNPLWRHRVV